MAQAQTLTEELAAIKIHAGIAGVVLLASGLILHVSFLSVLILQGQVNVFGLPIYTLGFFIGGFVGGLWAIFSGICYVTLSYRGKAQNGKQLYIRMIEFQLRWTLFFMLIVIAGIAMLGVALSNAWDVDTRLKAFTIASIAGCGITLLFTVFGAINLSKCTDKFGLKLTPPSKESLLTVFKMHGYVIPAICLHQVVWALVGLITPELRATEKPVRIAAFSVGGFVVTLLGMVTAGLCFKLVRYVNTPTENGRVMTATLVNVHKAWSLLFFICNVAGTGLYVASIGSFGDESEGGTWAVTYPFYIVANYVLSLLGNILLGYLMLTVMHYEQFVNVFGLNGKPAAPKTNNAPAKANNADNGATPKKTENKPAAKAGTASGNTNKAGTASGNTNAKTAGTKPAANATAKTSATATKPTVSVTKASGSNSNANPPTTSGATGTTTTVPDIEEVKERNRLLQEQIALQKQLNDLRQQQLQMPSDSVLYNRNNVQIGPGMPPVYTIETPSNPAPPSYDDVTSYPEKPL